MNNDKTFQVTATRFLNAPPERVFDAWLACGCSGRACATKT